MFEWKLKSESCGPQRISGRRGRLLRGRNAGDKSQDIEHKREKEQRNGSVKKKNKAGQNR